LRAIFVFLVTCMALLYMLNAQAGLEYRFGQFAAATLAAVGLAVVVLLIDIGTPHKKLSAISGVFLGLAAGLLVAYALSYVVDLVGVIIGPYFGSLTSDTKAERERFIAFLNILQGVKVLIGLITCYLGMSLVLQTKDDFRFV